MEPGSVAYKEWYLNKRRQDNALCQRAKRAQERDQKAAAQKESEECTGGASIVASVGNELSNYARQFQKVTAFRSRNLALHAIQELRGLSIEAQRACIEKFIAHPLIQGMIPDYLSDLPTVKLNYEVIGNIKSGMTSHCVGSRKTDVVVAKDIVCTFAASQSVVSCTGVARLLGVDRRNIKRALVRRLQLDAHEDAFWINRKRTTRATQVTAEMKAQVIEWWTTESSISPNRKDIVRKRLSVNMWTEHPVHYLQVSQVSIEGTTAFSNLCR